MPIDGLSLVGFLDRDSALNYFERACVFSDPCPEHRERAHAEARARLGEPFANPGQPDIQSLPDKHTDYLEEVQKHPRFLATIEWATAWSFRMIEIDRLLAHQFHVARRPVLCDGQPLSTPPTIEEMLAICLPTKLDKVPLSLSYYPGGLVIRTKDLNYRVHRALNHVEDSKGKVFSTGIVTGMACNLVQVIQLDGKCYLRNGYHRAFSLRAAGATHMPCLFLESTDFQRVGAVGGGTTFDRAYLESANPPTCGHFSLERAYAVRIKLVSRMIHVTWTELVLPEDD